MSLETEKKINDQIGDDDSKGKGLRVLTIGTDRNIFKIDSAVRKRVIEYGKLFDQLHIIVFSKTGHKLSAEKISDNVWAYPTNSLCKLFYFLTAVKIGKKIINDWKLSSVQPIKNFIISTQDPFETGIAGWLLARKFKLPLQLQIHTDFLSPYFWKESFLNKIRVIIGKFLVKRSSCIRVVSERIKNSLLQPKIFPPQPNPSHLPPTTYHLQPSIVVLPIFVDIEKIKNTPANFDARKKYPQFSFIIMLASRLEKEKNIPFAIEIMKELKYHHPKIGMIIIGEGKERKKLERLATKYNLQKNIIFEGWQSDLISYYKTANVFLSTSLYEGYGLTIIEALACGCPVISSDVGVAGEVISEGENGFVCPVNDKNCFTRKILEIMEIPSLKERLKLNSKMSISENLPATTKEEYLSKYRQIMENCAKFGNEKTK